MTASRLCRVLAVSLAALVAGCAASPGVAPPASVEPLFHDEAFAAPAAPIDPAAALAVSPAMRERLSVLRAAARRNDDARKVLMQAIAGQGDERLRIDYDASVTRTAAEAFDARRGNCLALVLMTAAFAHELGVPVRYQVVSGVAEWTHAGGYALAVGHVNVALDAPAVAGTRRWEADETLVIDFLPSQDASRLGSRPVGERTVVAMFLNNRAVEALTDDRLDDAYAWARAALRQDPGFDTAAVTLAVVYRERHRPGFAAAALEHVLARNPAHADALANLALVLRDQGRVADAEAVERRLVRAGSAPPFSALATGIAAYRDGRLELARRWFADAARRADDDAIEAEFWLARTDARLGDLGEAQRHLDRALAARGVPTAGRRYAAKIEGLKALADASPH